MSTFRSYIRLGMASKWRNRGGLGEEQSSFDQIFNKLGLGRDMNKGGMIFKEPLSIRAYTDLANSVQIESVLSIPGQSEFGSY